MLVSLQQGLMQERVRSLHAEGAAARNRAAARRDRGVPGWGHGPVRGWVRGWVRVTFRWRASAVSPADGVELRTSPDPAGAGVPGSVGELEVDVPDTVIIDLAAYERRPRGETTRAGGYRPSGGVAARSASAQRR